MRTSPSRRAALPALGLALAILAAVPAGILRAGGEGGGDDPTPPSAPPEVVMTATPAPSLDRGTVVGRQDLLEIKVFQLDEFDQTQRVADDGSITLPLLGRVEVAGLTREEVENRIASLLEERYLNDPQVTVFVKEHESRKVAITGAVSSPGTYEMLGDMTVLEMIARAGGVTGEAAKEIILIRRRPESPPERIVLTLENVLYRGDPTSNILVDPGDMIFVPMEEIIKVYVNGAVGSPGAIEVKRSEPITVLQAVTAAGGTTDRASERRVQIIRRSGDGTKQILPVDLKKIKQGRAEDVVLLKDDVVFVPEAFF